MSSPVYDPFADAARLGMIIVERPLDGLLGEYDGVSEIVLHPEQSERQKLCSCAHEVATPSAGTSPSRPATRTRPGDQSNGNGMRMRSRPAGLSASGT